MRAKVNENEATGHGLDLEGHTTSLVGGGVKGKRKVTIKWGICGGILHVST